MEDLGENTSIPLKWVFAILGGAGFTATALVSVTLYISSVDAKASQALDAGKSFEKIIEDVAEIKGILKEMNRHR